MHDSNGKHATDYEKSANVNKSVALKSNKFQHCHAIHSSCALLCMAIKDSCASVRMLNTPVLLTTVQFIAFFSSNLFIRRIHRKVFTVQNGKTMATTL